jgi:hypothetical protein
MLKYRLRTLAGFMLRYVLLVVLIQIILPVITDLIKDQSRLVRAAGVFATSASLFALMLYLIGSYQRFKNIFTTDMNRLHDWHAQTTPGEVASPKMVCRRCGHQATGEVHGNHTTD